MKSPPRLCLGEVINEVSEMTLTNGTMYVITRKSGPGKQIEHDLSMIADGASVNIRRGRKRRFHQRPSALEIENRKNGGIFVIR